MSDFILHHYQPSPFSEKIRTILGYKGLSYRAVTIPVVMPKPDLTALTGGYRKTPVLQQGAHVYCDTRLMARVIDAHMAQVVQDEKCHTVQERQCNTVRETECQTG